MTARAPLVVGSDGVPQQLQTGDSLTVPSLNVQGAATFGDVAFGGRPQARNTNSNIYAGYYEVYTQDGVRRGYWGYGDGSNNLVMTAENGWGIKILGTLSLGSPLAVACGGTGASTPSAALANFGILDLGLHDNCGRVSVASTSKLLFLPYGGNTLVFGGVQNTIPSAGLSFVPSSTPAALTKSYLYATPSGLVQSTTGWVFGADGRKYMNNGSGGAALTARMICMLYTDGNGNFVDSLSFRGCLNDFGRRDLPFQGPSTAGGTINAGAGANNSNFGATVLSWPDEGIDARIKGYGTTSIGGAYLTTQLYIDGSAVGLPVLADSVTANGRVPTLNGYEGGVAEGVHTVTPGISVNAGSASLYSAVGGFVRG